MLALSHTGNQLFDLYIKHLIVQIYLRRQSVQYQNFVQDHTRSLPHQAAW